jgi:hypothetical protein
LSPGTGAGQISLSSGQVTIGTNNDKTGYSLNMSQALPGSPADDTVGNALYNAVNGVNVSTLADSSIGALTFQTGAITSGVIAADAIGASELAADAVTEIVNGVLTTAMTETYATDGSAMTLAQALHMLWSAVGDFAISGTTLTCKKLDGSTAMTFTLNDATNPTSRTRTG